MSTDQTHSEDDRTLAGEYVLGTLDARAHALFERRLAAEPLLNAEVAFWQTHFAQLDEGFVEVAAPATSYRAIEARLFGAGQSSAALGGWWHNLALWRGFAAAGLDKFRCRA